MLPSYNKIIHLTRTFQCTPVHLMMIVKIKIKKKKISETKKNVYCRKDSLKRNTFLYLRSFELDQSF